jgi:hypothetical protein
MLYHLPQQLSRFNNDEGMREVEVVLLSAEKAVVI